MKLISVLVFFSILASKFLKVIFDKFQNTVFMFRVLVISKFKTKSAPLLAMAKRALWNFKVDSFHFMKVS